MNRQILLGGGGGVTFNFPVLSDTMKFNLIYISISSYEYLYSLQSQIFNNAAEPKLKISNISYFVCISSVI